MNEQVFPPSPNWYLSCAVACDSKGVLAYGHKNNLVIVKTACEDSEKFLPDVEVISSAHKERLNVVVFSPETCESHLHHCVATSGDDAVVKIWKLETMMPILAHISHGTESKVICMDWSRANPGLIVSMDNNNNIVCWDLPSNSTRILNLGKLCASTLSCCPYDKNLLAVGCRTGLVCVANIQGRGKILFRMRGHDSEVVSLAWCPVGYNIFAPFKAKSEKQPENQELLLASSAKERTIFLWRANGDGRYELALTIPTHLMTGQRSNKAGTTDMNWVSLCWPRPNMLVCSTRIGRIIAWDLEASYRNKPNMNSGAGDSFTAHSWRLLHSCHSRVIFNIVTPHLIFNVPSEIQHENWRQASEYEQTEDPLVIWSSSQDRLIVGFDINANKEVVCIPTIGGIVHCIAASPIDPNRIAFGVSDAVIRVWNLSSTSTFDVTFLWQKIRGKVTSIAWHPTQENRLAFGTSEGRIGFFDTLNSNKQPVLLRPYHTMSLYTVVWGPALFATGEVDGVSEVKYALYSCSEGDAVQYDIHNPEAEAKNLNQLPHINSASRKSLIRTDIAWKQDNSILAIGNEDGSVQLINYPDGTVLHTIYAHKNLVQSLAWHPEGTATDTSYSPCQHWLAVASKKSPIKVYNLAPLLEGDGSGDVECVAVFSQHKQCVVSMSWSPHVSGQLVSASFDETAQVWDVLQQQPIGNYPHHAGVLHSACWSPLDPDLVMTGSVDGTLRVWRISTLDQTVPIDKKKEKKKAVSIQYLTKNTNNTAEKEFSTEEASIKSELRVSPMPSIGVAAQEKEPQTSKSSRQKTRSYFPIWAQMWQGSTNNILNRFQLYLNPEYITDAEPNLLGNRPNVLELLNLEEQNHQNNGNLECIQHMALWKGDIGEMIRETAKKRKLSDWLLSLAPMVSQRLWLDTCHMYAEQLAREGNIYKAASYLLACHKVEEAIQLFLQHHLYREALTVAKLRLSPEDPLTANIVQEWSQQQILDGHYERAAECLVSIGDLTGAAELLGKRNVVQCLSLAANLASKGKSEPMALCYARNCVMQCLLNNDWDLAMKVTSEYPALLSLSILNYTHRTINELLCDKLSIDESLHLWINKQFKKEHKIDPVEFYDDLDKNMERNVPDTKKKLWLTVSEDVALSACAADEVTAIKHLVHAANVCYQYQLMHPDVFPLLRYIRWLAPEGVLNEKNIFKMESQEENLVLLRRSLRFFLYAGYFSWLQSDLPSIGANSTSNNDNCGESTEKDCLIAAKSLSAKIQSATCNQMTNHDIKIEGLTTDEVSQTSPILSDSEVVEKLENRTLIDEEANHEGSGDVILPKLNWEDLIVPILTNYANELPSEVNTLEYYKQKVEIKKWEQEVASLVAYHNKTKKQTADDVVLDDGKEETKVLHGLKKLDELKEQKEIFERQRESTPNPFVTYCHFTNVCDYLIKEKNMDILKNVSETAIEHWLNASAKIK